MSEMSGDDDDFFHYNHYNEDDIDYDEKEEEQEIDGDYFFTENIQGNITEPIYKIIRKEDIMDDKFIKNFGIIKNFKNIYVRVNGSVFKKIIGLDDDGQLKLSKEDKVFEPVTEICINVYNIPVPETDTEIIEHFIKPTVELEEQFIDYYDRVKDLTSAISSEIRNGNYMARKVKKFSEYRDKIEKYYDICSKIKDKFEPEKFKAVVYRAVRQGDKYNPILFEEGDTINNIFAISASMNFEFPTYLWLTPKQYCCLLCIKVDNLYDCSIPVDIYDKYDMYTDLYKLKPDGYQSEINLKPGKFYVEKIEDVTLPSLYDYKKLLYKMYDELNQEEAKEIIKNMGNCSTDDSRCYSRNTIRMITVKYTPFLKLELVKTSDFFDKYK